MIKTRILVGLAAAGALLAACGSSDSSKPSAAAPAPPPPSAATSPAPAPAAAAGASVSVKAATSPLGQILVGPDGRTLYAFTNDTEAKSTCYGTCAEAWPPAVVDRQLDRRLPASTPASSAPSPATTAPSSSTAGKFPLYYFSGDARPGDVNGQGSGDVWFVVDTKAKVVKDAAVGAPPRRPRPPRRPPAAPAPAASAGRLVAREDHGGRLDGRTLYAFTKDANGTSTCARRLRQGVAPGHRDGRRRGPGPATSRCSPRSPRPDGARSSRWASGRSTPSAGDAAPGDINGQGSGGSWFVVGQDGKLIKG